MSPTRTWLWALAVLCLTLVVLNGCSQKQQTAAVAPPADDGQEHDAAAGDEEAEAEAEPEMPEMEKPKVDDVAKQAAGEDADEAINAIKTLASIVAGDDDDLAQDAVLVLMKVVHEGEQPRVRAEAIRALAKRADQFIDVIAPLTQSSDPVVRDAAILGLGNASKGSGAEAVLKQLMESSDRDVQVLAKQALEAIRVGVEHSRAATLVAQLGNPVNDASAQAAIELKIMGAEALPDLEKAIRFSQNPRQRHAATMCVALICAGTSPKQIEFAKSVKSVKKGENRGGPANLDGLPILVHAIRDPDPMTREVAAQGLGYLGTEKAAAPLAKALRDEDVHVRRRAASALILTPAESVVDQMIQAALHDDDETVRRFAVEALGWVGGPKASKALIAAAKDPAPQVRRYAATQLGHIKEEGALQALIGLYKDARKRELALKTLDEKMDEQDVRWAAVQAVSDLRNRAAKDLLLTALDDPVPQVANAAETGLQKLGIAKRRMPGVD